MTTIPLEYNIRREIPSKQLISEVRKRPELYDKNSQNYLNAPFRRQKWEEVANALFPKQWKRMNKAEKRETIISLQKRWGNLRTTFVREVKKRKSNAKKSDRKYCYYDDMMFIYKFLALAKDDDENEKNSETSEVAQIYETLATNEFEQNNESKDDDEESSERDWQDEEYLEENSAQEDDSMLEKLVTNRSFKKENPGSNDSFGMEFNDDDPLNEDNLRRHYENSADSSSVDQDMNFAVSLVPMLKRLPLNKKIQAQIEILKVFQKIL